MRIFLCATLFVAASCRCDLGPLFGRVDAGVSDDAGFPPDAGADAGDGGSNDAGFVDGGVDAGVIDGGPIDAGCLFPTPVFAAFTPDGSEDFVATRELPPQPEDDLLATWSHVDGDNFVIDMRWAAPPFRPSFHGFGLTAGFARPGSCENTFCEEVCEPGYTDCCGAPACCSGTADCFFQCSACVGSDASVSYNGVEPTGSWPPENYQENLPDGGVDVGDVCAHVFVTPNEPFLRLIVPLSLASANASPPIGYLIDVNSCWIDSLPHKGNCEGTWSTPTDLISSRGNSAPAQEAFESVCSVVCSNEQ